MWQWHRLYDNDIDNVTNTDKYYETDFDRDRDSETNDMTQTQNQLYMHKPYDANNDTDYIT